MVLVFRSPFITTEQQSWRYIGLGYVSSIFCKRIVLIGMLQMQGIVLNRRDVSGRVNRIHASPIGLQVVDIDGIGIDILYHKKNFTVSYIL